MRVIGCDPSWPADYRAEIETLRVVLDDGIVRIRHIRAFAVDDPHIARELTFRDYLRMRPDAAIAYERVKREAAAKHWYDPEGYVRHKEETVARTLGDALDRGAASAALGNRARPTEQRREVRERIRSRQQAARTRRAVERPCGLPLPRVCRTHGR